MRTQKLSRLVNVAAIVAALTLPACGGEPQIDDPVVTPPPDAGNGVGSLLISVPSRLTEATLVLDDTPVSPDLVAFPYMAKDLSEGNLPLQILRDGWKPATLMATIVAGRMNAFFALVRPMVEDLTGQIGWAMTENDGRLVDEAPQMVSYQEREANSQYCADCKPCETGTFLISMTARLKVGCAISPDEIEFCAFWDGQSCWLQALCRADRTAKQMACTNNDHGVSPYITKFDIK